MVEAVLYFVAGCVIAMLIGSFDSKRAYEIYISKAVYKTELEIALFVMVIIAIWPLVVGLYIGIVIYKVIKEVK